MVEFVVNPTGADDGIAGAPDVPAACEAVADLLVSLGYELPSLYLLRGERLRCYASRGYWQVLDGFSRDVGVIGTVLATGSPIRVEDPSRSPAFMAAIPGIHGQVAVPVKMDHETIGVLSVETRTVLPDDAVDVLDACAQTLVDRIRELGGPPAMSAAEFVTEQVVGLAAAAQAADVQRRLLAAARGLVAPRSVVLALLDDDGTHRVAGGSGPLAAALSALAPAELALAAAWVEGGTSCYVTGGTDTDMHHRLTAMGARYTLILALRSQGCARGLLIVSDENGEPCTPYEIALLEQLVAHGAASLRSFETVDNLRELAFTDALTGVGNVAAIGSYVEQAGSGPHVVGLVDIDDFKAVNDTYGHAYGDDLLREVAALLVGQVGTNGRVFRRGGDEFVLIRTGDDGVARALGVTLTDAARSAGRCTLSIGLTVGDTLDADIFTIADAALYEVKRRGRDGYQVACEQTTPHAPAPRFGVAEGWPVPTTLIDEIHEVAFTTDASGRWTFLNRAWEKLIGRVPEDCLDVPVEQWVHADDVMTCRSVLTDLYTGAVDDVRAQWRWITASGATRWCEVWAHPLHTPDGGIVGCAGTLTDVTDRRATETALRSQLGLSTVISGVLEQFARLEPDDIDGGIDVALSRLGRFAAVDRVYLFRFSEDLTTTSCTHEWCADGVAPCIDDQQDLPFDIAGEWLHRFQAGRAVHVPSVAHMPADQAELKALLEQQDIQSLVVVPLTAGARLIGFLGFDAVRHERVWTEREIDLLHLVANALVSVVSRHEATRQLALQALVDPLTALPNRPAALAHIQSLLDAAHGVACVALVDLDGFRTINGTLGHRAGDEVLRGVADRIAAVLREDDMLARVGGDRFAIVCPNIGRLAGVAGGHGTSRSTRSLRSDRSQRSDRVSIMTDFGDRVAAAVRTPTSTHDVELYVTACIGLASSDGYTDAGALLRDAETAMRRARRLGRDRIALFEPRAGVDSAQRLALAGQLRRAIDDDQLRVHYQPIVELTDHGVVGVEALVRWRHPDRGMLAPDGFIGVAEHTGQILSLGRWVLLEACHQLAQWRAAGRDDLTVNVNISALQLADGGLIDTVNEAVGRAGLPFDRLTLELTESSLVADPEHSTKVLTALTQMGVRLSIDDFGTGFSSLNYLQNFPVDELKIDRSFVSRIGTTTRDTAMLVAFRDLAAALDLHVIAEGVETEDQRTTLVDNGLRVAQGHLLGRPAAAQALDERLLRPVRDRTY